LAFEYGLLYSFRNPPQWRRPWDAVYDEILDHIVAMEQIGYDTIWLTEHHFSEDGYLPSLAVMSAALAVGTTRVWIGHSIVEVPLYHPVHLAEDIAVCDILSHGRIRFGVGLGRIDPARSSFATEGDVFGVPNSGARGAIFEEQLEIIRKCWAEGSFEHHGRHFQLPRIDVTPKPVQPGGPGLWFGVLAPRALERAARMGHGWTGPTEYVKPYLDAVREKGREREAGNAVAFMVRYPALDPERAQAQFAPHLDYVARWYGNPVRQEPHFAPPDVVAEDVRAAQAAGATGALWFAPFAGASAVDSIPIFQSIIEDVKPLATPATV
jgi:alkanesulfonate monooxygenase SsuD/methylene tetrahydromethanopterin reductase-like flavin-dependent oxidoreductase (luciferase family)